MILALDLGTTTGYALGAPGAVVSGVWSFKPQRFEGGGMRFLRFRRQLEEIVGSRPILIANNRLTDADRATLGAVTLGIVVQLPPDGGKSTSIPGVGYGPPRITEVVFEEVRRHAGTDAAHIYGGMLGHLSAFCEEHSIPYEGVPVGTIKKFGAGKGNASKEEMIGAVESWGYEPADDNEADAIALLHWRMSQVYAGVSDAAPAPAVRCAA